MIVRDGEVVAEGVTEASGRHAEVVALEAAGELARGATLYVTLEPCAHHGTTPPCTDAILAAGVERVVFGARDPNPEAAGGEARLRAQGVDVEFVDSWEARTPERGVAHLGARPAPVRDLQGGRDARRARRRARGALGDGRGEPSARPRAAGAGRRGRSRRRYGAGRPAAARRARRRDAEGPAAAARLLAGAAARRARPGAADAARSPPSWRCSPPTASSRCSSRAARPWPRRSSRPTSSTSCCSSWRPSWRATGRRRRLRYPHRARCRISRPGRWVPMCSSKPMSTTPDTGALSSGRADDQLVTHLSHWLTRQIGNDELLRKLQEIDTAELPPGGRSAIAELAGRAACRRARRAGSARGLGPRDARDARLRRLASRDVHRADPRGRGGRLARRR